LSGLEIEVIQKSVNARLT